MKKFASIIAGLCLVAGMANAQELANFNFGGGAQTKSPDMQGDKVTFRLNANYATQVNLVGSWMENPYGAGVPMV